MLNGSDLVFNTSIVWGWQELETKKVDLEFVLEELKNQKSDLIINLASKEYFTVLGKLPEDVNVVTPTFKDYKNGKFKIISFYAKKARGMMARWIIENKITDFEKLSGFNVDGYKYSKAESTATTPVFLRKA